MAIAHIHIQTISRGKGRSATAAASYRSATVIKDTRERRRMRQPLPELSLEPKGARRRLQDLHPELPGRVHDYRAKMGVLREKVKTLAGVALEYLDRSVLWNAAEDAEPRCNAVIAREMDIALPHELSLEANWGIVEDIADFLMNRYRVAVDFALHRAPEGHDQRNIHAHIMWTSREVTEEGFGKKTRILDGLKTRSGEFKAIRQAYEDCVNAALEKAGLDIRIDVRTLKEQGIERIPQIHVGVNGTAMSDKGEKPESRERYDRQGRVTDWEDIDAARSRAEFNAEIIDLNKYREQFGPLPLEVQIKNIERYIAILMEKVTDLEALIPASMLPTWARLLIERYRIKAAELLDIFIRAKEADDERQEEKKREGTHARMKRMREEIEQLQQQKERRNALQRLYTRIEHIVTTRSAVPIVNIERQPTRMLSVEQFRIELVARAEVARARVPPEYRVRVEIPNVVWDFAEHKPEESSLGYHFQTGPPADNGGLVEPPPPLVPAFNEMANPSPEQPYKQKVSIGFGL